MPETGTTLASESLGWSLETMAFVSPMPWEQAEAPDPGGSVLLTTIAFSGARHGVLQIAAPAAFAQMVAQNLLSFDAGAVPDDRVQDVLKELTNITCGTFIRRLALHPGDLPQMGIPRIEQLKLPAGWVEFIESSACTVLEADGFPVAIRVLDAA